LSHWDGGCGQLLAVDGRMGEVEGELAYLDAGVVTDFDVGDEFAAGDDDAGAFVAAD